MPFHAVGDKYLTAVAEVAGAMPVLLPAMGIVAAETLRAATRLTFTADAADLAGCNVFVVTVPKAFTPDGMRNLLEGRFIDAVQAVAASRTMDALHEKRAEFVAAVSTGKPTIGIST